MSVNGENYIMLKNIYHFPRFSKGKSNSNHMRAQTLWKYVHLYPQSSVTGPHAEVPNALTLLTQAGHKNIRLNDRFVCRRKRATWMEAFHNDL